MQKERRKHIACGKRLLAGLLSLVMIASYMPSSVLAAELTPGTDVIETVDATAADAPGTEVTDVASDGSDTAQITVATGDDAADDAADPDKKEDATEADTAEEVVASEADDTELLGVAENAKYGFAITADDAVDSGNLSLSYDFKASTDGSGDPIEGGSGSLGITPATGVRTNSVAEQEFPEGAKSVVIKVTTAGDANVVDAENSSIRVTEDDENWTNAVSLTEEVVDALTGDGYVLVLGDNWLELQVNIELIKNSNSGGGDPQQVADGQYKVHIQKGKGLPNDATPTVNVQFSNDEGPTPVTIPEGETEVTKNWTAFPNNASDSVTISIPAEFKMYLQSGFIEVFENGQRIEGHEKSLDLYDYFKSLNTLEDGDDWIYSFDIAADESYQFDIVFSYTRSLSWSYKEKDKGKDNYVENCKLYLLDEEGNERAYVDEAYDSTDPRYPTEDYVNYQLEIGKKFRFKLVPDYGYQVAGLQINSYTIAPSEIDGEVGIFYFTMKDSNFHLNGVVKQVNNTSEVNEEISDIVTSIDIQDADSTDEVDPLEKAVTDNGIGGTLDFIVSKADEIENWASTEGIFDGAKAVTSIDIEIDNILSKGTEEYWDDNIAELDKPVTVTLGFEGSNEDGVEYRVVREHEGAKTAIEAVYNAENKTLSFDTDKFSSYTIVRSSIPTDNVIFDLNIENVNPANGVGRITPISGLDAVTDGADGKYKYSGTGDIIFKVEKATGPEDWDIIKRENAEEYRLNAYMSVGDENKEPWHWGVDYQDSGTVCTIPAALDGWYPVQGMLSDAVKAVEQTDKVPTITLLSFDWDKMPARQVIFKETDKVNFKTVIQKITYDMETGDPIGTEPFSNIITDDTAEDDRYETLYYITGDTVVFEADPVKDNVKIKSFIVKTIDAHPEDDEHDRVYITDTAAYPDIRTVDAKDSEDGYEGNVYEIDVPQNKDWDPWSRLGVEITPVIEEVTTVDVVFEDGGKYFTEEGEGAFDVTARIGAQLVPISYEGNGKFTAEVTKDADVTIGITSTDGMNVVASVVADDSKNDKKALKASKNGEYSLVTNGLGAEKTASLTVKTEPVTKLMITDASDNPYELSNKKYTMEATDTFNAYLLSGSKIDEGVLTPVQVKSGVTFKNNKEAITTGITDGKLTTTGNALSLAGKSLSLKAEYSGKTYSATIAFFAPVTAVSIKDAKNGKLSLPYNTTKYYGLKIDKGANQYAVDAKIVTVSGETVTPVKDIDFGNCDGKDLYISAGNVVSKYFPGDSSEFAFFVGETCVSDVYEITFTDGLSSDKAPTVKANDKLSTNRAIGLSLSLPKGVKATDDMYYKIVATTDKCADEDRDSADIGDGETLYWDPGLAYFDEEHKEVVKVFKTEVVEYVPASLKTYALDVSDDPRNSEDGWYREYDVKVSVVYVKDALSYPVERGTGSGVSSPVRLHTKDCAFETKLTLAKKAPKKIYTGERNVPLAVPKFSAATTVKAIDRIELYDAAGNGYGGWSRWNASDDITDDDNGMNWYLSYNDYDGCIYLDTTQDWIRGEEEDTDRLKPGKYTMVVYAVSGPGVPATAKMDFTVVTGIDYIDLNAPSTVYKEPGKKVSFKVSSELSGYYDEWGTPATKKLDWEVLGYGGTDEDGDVITIGLPDALEGKVTVKNGTVTIDPKLNVGQNTSDYQFVVVARPSEYYPAPHKRWCEEHRAVEEKDVEGITDVITITTKVRKPTDIIFRWNEYRWNEEQGYDEFVGYNYSDITEGNIKTGAKFYTNSIRGSQIIVYDQYGEEIDEFNVKASGVTVDSEHCVEVKKPGKATITVTTADGTKQSKTLKFTLMYTDELFKLNTLIQDSTYDRMDGWEGSFLNAVNDRDPMGGPGRDDTAAANAPFKSNDCASNKPIFVYVTGVRIADRDGDKAIERKEEDIDYHDNAMINHTLKVKSGGKIIDTEYNTNENFVKYTIMPSAPKTVINVTDNTVVRSADRKKTTYTYTVTNSAIGAAKALKIEADKKNIINSMDSDAAEYTASGLQNPNTVTYTVTGAPQGTAYARITEDDFGNADWVFRKALGLERDFDWEHATEAEQREYDEENFNNKTYGAEHQLTNGKFTIDYFEEWNDNGNTRYHMDRIPTGKYSFYVTIGTKSEGKFVPTALPTKVTVTVAAAPKVTAKWKNTKFKITGDSAVNLEVPTVTNGTGVRNWSDDQGGDAYWTKSSNVKGISNAFTDLFETVNPANTDPVLKANEIPQIKTRNRSDHDIPEQKITIDKNHVAVIHSWGELKLLKEGKYMVGKDDDAEGWYSDKPDAKLYVSAKAQQKAYKAWIKANTTGFIEYRVVGYTGQETQLYQQITLDIEEFVDGAKIIPKG